MRTSKPYTNVTFTRRVDREAGRHRTGRTPAGPLQCERCGSLYVRRRWVLKGHAWTAGLEGATPPRPTLCKACRMILAGQFAGEVRLSGAFLAAHRAEIERLIRNEAKRAAEDNPTGRIVSLQRPAPDRIVIRTTTEHLARRLGQSLKKAHGGRIRYGVADENKFEHVTWTRDR